MNVIVIDDIFKDPDKIRAQALKASYSDENKHYPGMRSRLVRIDELNDQMDAIKETLRRSGMNVDPAPFQTKGVFQYLGANSRKLYIHVDLDIQCTGLVYLSNHKKDYPGTSFFAHKESGLERLDSVSVFRDLKPGLTMDSAIKMLRRDRFDLSRWKKTLHVPGKYNRLLVFQTNHFHIAEKAWGKTPKDARLTYNFAIN